jgi:cysteine desulfurase / selenocysteine lyase
MMPLIPKSDFVGLESVAHLCSGGEAPWLRSHDQASARMGALKSAGMAGRDELFVVYERAKARVARMLGVEPARVAFLAHASEGLNQAVKAVPWRAGDNAVFADLEYPSLIYPAAVLGELGVEPRVLKTRGHYLSLDELARAVDRRTRLVLVSQVSYLTGQRVDLARCAEIARAAGAWLAVDATHALGVVPVPGQLCDFVVSSCYKWLLATHGVGIFAYDPARVGDIEPATMGWHSVLHRGGFDDPLKMPLRPDASRLEAGNPNFFGLFVLDNALAVHERLDRSAVLEYVVDLSGELRSGLVERGFPVITPEPREERAGNVCFLDPDAKGLADRLARRGVLVWGGEGRIRVSTHVYNDRADVRRFLEAMDAVTGRVARASA